MLLEVQDLTYTYPRGESPAVNGVSFGIEEGEILGFLGPNGAGKTTTQMVLTGILSGWRGSVRAFGRDLRELGSGYYERVGVCFEFPNLYEKLTAEENLEFYRSFFSVPTDDPSELLARFDLPVRDKRTVGQFSKGMQMRLVLVRSLVNRPRLWFLDEPTGGQDPQHAVAIRELIRRRRDEGTTVFLTTHNMSLADELCDQVALIVDGRIVAVDSPRALKLTHSRRTVRVEWREDDDTLASAEFGLDDPAEKRAFCEAVATRRVETIHSQEPSLQDVFIRMTGRHLRG